MSLLCSDDENSVVSWLLYYKILGGGSQMVQWPTKISCTTTAFIYCRLKSRYIYRRYIGQYLLRLNIRYACDQKQNLQSINSKWIQVKFDPSKGQHLMISCWLLTPMKPKEPKISIIEKLKSFTTPDLERGIKDQETQLFMTGTVTNIYHRPCII